MGHFNSTDHCINLLPKDFAYALTKLQSYQINLLTRNILTTYMRDLQQAHMKHDLSQQLKEIIFEMTLNLCPKFKKHLIQSL